MLADTRMPVRAPAAMKITSQSKRTERFIDAVPEKRLIESLEERIAGEWLQTGVNQAKPFLPELVDRGQDAGDAQRPRRAHSFLPVGVQCPQGFRGGNSAGKAQLLDIDHLALHGDRHRDPQTPPRRKPNPT